MLSQQEISDRFEIQDLIVHYSHLIDAQKFDDLDEVFTPDAFIDYSAFGGAKGDYAEVKEFLKQALPAFKNSQHMISNYQIKIAGDEATGRIMCFNPMELNLPDQGNPVFFLGLWYLDKYVRTDKGWRISERVEEKSYGFNVPDFMEL